MMRLWMMMALVLTLTGCGAAARNTGPTPTLPTTLRDFRADNADLAHWVGFLATAYADGDTVDIPDRVQRVMDACNRLVQTPALSSDHDRAWCRRVLDGGIR